MSWILLYTTSEWAIRLIMLPIITSRRRPDTAMAWLLVVFFLPWPGLVLFLTFGSNRLSPRRKQKSAECFRRLEQEGQRFVGDPNIVHPKLTPQLDSTVRMAEQLGSLPILGGNRVEFLADTQLVIDRLIADIDRAENHVHLLFYIFSDDDTGKQVMDALGRAEARGVQCRLLVDSVGSWRSIRSLAAKSKALGIEMYEMLPVGVFRRRIARFDLRNHRKLAVIDGRIAYTGSQNIVNADYGRKNMAWHDMMVRLTGPISIELQAVFVTDWYLESGQMLGGNAVFASPELDGSVAAQTLPSGPIFPVENYQRLVVSAIHGAQQRVIITTPYFVPDEPLLQAIQIAVWRGVQVDLIVPQRCDQRIVGAAARAYYQDVLDAGAHMHLHTQGLLHSKTMTVDNSIALIGSSNFDIRSFAINFEINMLLYGADVTERLRHQQLKYLGDSIELSAEEWQQRSRSARIVDNMARLMSPLL